MRTLAAVAMAHTSRTLAVVSVTQAGRVQTAPSHPALMNATIMAGVLTDAVSAMKATLAMTAASSHAPMTAKTKATVWMANVCAFMDSQEKTAVSPPVRMTA